jgi:toxin YoeB
MYKRINLLIQDVLRNPYEGLGKPEALKYDLKGFWSRRITEEHRIVYAVDENTITVIHCMSHYEK